MSSAYMSPRLRNSSRFQPLEIQSPSRDSSRFESVAQSIETPIHDASRSFYSVPVNHPLPSSYDYPVGHVDSEDWNKYTVAQQNLDGVQQTTKRRRVEDVDSRSLRQHNGPNDLQRTMLIPIGNTKRLDAVAQQQAVFRRVEEQESAVMPTHSHSARPAQTIVHLVKRDDPASHYYPTESDHDISFRTDSPRQRQVLNSPQKSHSRVFSTTVFEVPSERPAPEHIRHGSVYTLPYARSAPYVSLPREIPYASDIVASGSERRGVPGAVLTGHAQNYNAVFGQTSQLRGNLMSEEIQPRVRPEDGIEQPTRLSTYNGQTESSVHRARRPLPLERSFEELKPTWQRLSRNEANDTKYRNSNVGTAYANSVMGEHQNPLELRNIYTRDGLPGAKATNNIQYKERHMPLEVSIQHENRWD